MPQTKIVYIDILFFVKNKEYTDAVNASQYPEESLVPLDTPFKDERGVIQNLLNTPINGAAIIASKKGSRRSNHWHKKDFHYLYIVSGKVEYYERNLNEDGSNIKPYIYIAGDMFFTPPNKVHLVVFLEDTVMISLSKQNRDHDSHESDVVRVKF